MHWVWTVGGAVAPNMGQSGRRVGRPVEAARRSPRRQRPNKVKSNLKQTIDNVAAEESSQKRGACRFAIWEAGSGPFDYYGNETGKEIARRTGCLYRDR